MSEKPPLYNHTPEESQSQDPSTTSQPHHPMNATAENYMSRYTPTIASPYPLGTASSVYNQGQLHQPISQWDPQPPTYRDIHPDIYYNTANPTDSRQNIANTPYASPYARWPTQAPVPLTVETQQITSPASDYYPPRPSPVAYRPSGEAGPSRTQRSSYRRSAQDLSSNIPQTDGSSADPSEYSPTPPPSSKRSVGVATKPTVTGDSKSFSCNLCTASFTRKGDCLRHRRSVHTRETPYDCQGCGERFTRSDIRGKHWKADPGCETGHWREVCKAMGKESLVDDF